MAGYPSKHGGDVDYVNALYQYGIKGYFDALATHPYTGSYPSGAKYGQSYGFNECLAGVDAAKLWCGKLGVERIHQAMLNAADHKPIWFTEFGFDSNTAWNGSGINGQATHLSEAVATIRQWDFVDVACWYQLVDQNSKNNARESQFGLFYDNLTIKPAGTAYKNGLNAAPKPRAIGLK